MKKVVVIGSNGWLAGRLISMLKHKYPSLHITGFDIRPAHWGQPIDRFVLGDVSNLQNVKDAIQTGVDTVFHVAAVVSGPRQLLEKVNVAGTLNVITASMDAGVERIIYTSSASVVFDGKDILNGTEDLPYQSKNLDYYNRTKATAEAAILHSNSNNLATVALRPHSIYGPGDSEAWPRMLQTAQKGSLKWKFAEDKYLSSYTYIDNICYAEILAAEKLIENPKEIGGKAYNINDGVDGKIWSNIYRVSAIAADKSTFGRISIPFGLLYRISMFFWMISMPLGNFTPYVLKLLSTNHTYSIKKAQEELGYKPIVESEEGWKLTLDSFADWPKKNPTKKSPHLKTWLIIVTLLSIFGALQAFWSTETLKTKQFSLQPGQVTPLAAHLFGAWTLVTSAIRLSCAFNLQNKVLYNITRFTFVVAFAIYGWEYFVAKTIPLIGASAPGIVSTTSLIWMTFFPPK